MADGDKEMALRYDGSCAGCGVRISRGTRAIYNSSSRTVRHLDCAAARGGSVAGASAMRQYERRTARDQARVADRRRQVQAVYGSGFIGKVATFLAVDDAPRRSTEVWKQGAIGEARVAEHLDRLWEAGVAPLHDRRIPGTRANIDHIAITPWGVWVIDAKRYVNKAPALATKGGLFGIGATEHLTVGGRRKDELVDGLSWQAGLVKEAVGAAVPVRAALVFVDADWPLLGGDFVVRGIHVVWPRRLPKLLLRREAPSVDVAAVERIIESRFPSA